MKKVYTLIAAIGLFTVVANGQARPAKKAVQNGNWSTNSTWQGGVGPVSGDSIIIPASINVTLTGDITLTDARLDIFGTLTMNEPNNPANNDLIFRFSALNKVPNAVVRIYNNSASIVRGTNSSGSARVYIRPFGGSDVQKYVSSGTSLVGPASALATTTTTTTTFENATASSLPVVLVSFDAVKQSTGVAISWKTQQEQNTKVFLIEKSIDGASYKAIGSVPAAGNSSTPLSYSFNDASAVSGIVYYRVRIVDLDGKEGFTPVKAVRASANAVKLGVYPNPAVSVANVVVDNAEQLSFSLNIFNRNGQLVAQQRAAAGTNAVNVDVSRFAAGDYMIDVQFANGNRQSSKLIVAQH